MKWDSRGGNGVGGVDRSGITYPCCEGTVCGGETEGMETGEICEEVGQAGNEVGDRRTRQSNIPL